MKVGAPRIFAENSAPRPFPSGAERRYLARRRLASVARAASEHASVLIAAGSRQGDSPGRNWYPHPELNRDLTFRKRLLYPFELWGRARRTIYRRPAIASRQGALRPAIRQRLPFREVACSLQDMKCACPLCRSPLTRALYSRIRAIRARQAKAREEELERLRCQILFAQIAIAAAQNREKQINRNAKRAAARARKKRLSR